MICQVVPEGVAPPAREMRAESEIVPPVSLELVEDLTAENLAAVLRRAQRHTEVGHRVMAYYLDNMQRRGLYQVLGFASAVHFAEKRMGLEAPVARQLLRVGRALRELRLIDHAFAECRICWTAVRLLCTIALPENEAAWLERALELSTRELEREEWHVHHIIWRQYGGRSIAKNCITLCIRCHMLVHAGQLRVSGSAPHGVDFRDASGRRLDRPLELPQPGDITVKAIPSAGTRVPSGDAEGVDAELRIENLPARVDPPWWSRHEHLFNRNDRRKSLELAPGHPQEPPESSPALPKTDRGGDPPQRPPTLAARESEERSG